MVAKYNDTHATLQLLLYDGQYMHKVIEIIPTILEHINSSYGFIQYQDVLTGKIGMYMDYHTYTTGVNRNNLNRDMHWKCYY
jgi:hypothetical protein